MSQTDMNVANADGATVRADLNAHIGALVTLSSGAVAPSPTFGNMWWFDTAADILKIRDEANTVFVNTASLVGSTWIPIRSGVLLGTAAVVNTGTADTDVPTNTNLKGTTREYSQQQSFDGTVLTDAVNISWDLNDEQVAQVTLAGNRTLDNPTNLKDGGVYILEVIQDATGSRTLAYGTAYKFPAGSAPVLSTGVNDVDFLTFVSDGTNMFGVAQLDFS